MMQKIYSMRKVPFNPEGAERIHSTCVVPIVLACNVPANHQLVFIRSAPPLTDSFIPLI